jgi:hypothetical protein
MMLASNCFAGEQRLERAEPQRGHRQQSHGVYFRMVDVGEPRIHYVFIVLTLNGSFIIYGYGIVSFIQVFTLNGIFIIYVNVTVIYTSQSYMLKTAVKNIVNSVDNVRNIVKNIIYKILRQELKHFSFASSN